MRDRGSALIWLGMAAIGVLIAYGMHRHMPLAVPACVPDSPDYERYRTANEDCAAVDRMLASVGRFVDSYHDDIAAMATVVIAAYTVVLGMATRRLWRSADDQLREFRRSLRHAEAVATQQTADMQESIGVARRSADAALAATRPWVIPKFTVTHIAKTAAGLNLGAHIELTNIGNSPASHVFVSARFVQESTTLAELDIQQEVCQQVSTPEVVKKAGLVVFPRQSAYSNQVAVAEVTLGPARFFLVGCVAYLFEGSEQVHQTGFLMGLSDGEPKGGVPPLAIINIHEEDGALPDQVSARLSLHQMLYGAFAT